MKHKIESLTDIVELATPENIDLLTSDVKELLISTHKLQELSDKKVVIKSFIWDDDPEKDNAINYKDIITVPSKMNV